MGIILQWLPFAQTGNQTIQVPCIIKFLVIRHPNVLKATIKLITRPQRDTN